MEYQYARLSNGIRIIHKATNSTVSHCGVVIHAGSRDELPEEYGMAHFIEHVIFKGTRQRKAYHILSRLENVGGELNAFTGKEETFIYASFLSQYYERTLELFSDILLRSTFPEKELSKEKDVIIDEINSYRDSPAELIFDEFEDLLFKGHPIGHSILGNPQTVRSFSRNDVLSFIRCNYTTDRMVICSAGSITIEKLAMLAEKYFSDLRPSAGSLKRQVTPVNDPSNVVTDKSNYQVHCILGSQAYNVYNDRRHILTLLTNLLGGPGMNSRLNLTIREKHGYAYDVEAHYQPYSDTGMFNIYLGTENGELEKSLRLIHKEFKNLRENKMGVLQLHRAKHQIIGQMAIALESNLNELISIGKTHLFFDHVDTIAEMIGRVNSITTTDLKEVANDIFRPDCFSMLTFVPKSDQA